MRLGLFGGTFDPVHLGHLAIAQAALEQAGLDQLIFLPAARNPFKESTCRFGPEERLELLRLALAGDPLLSVSDWELLRPPPSYTIETVRHFAEVFPGAELFWLIGSDQLAGLPRWREFTELAQKVTFLCAPRQGSPVPASSSPPFPSSPFPLLWLVLPPSEASSTEVRRRLGLGEIPADLLPTRVCQRLQSGPKVGF